MNRREFVKTAFLAAGAALLPANAAAWAKEYVERHQRVPVKRILYRQTVTYGWQTFERVEFDSLHVGDVVLVVCDWGGYAESAQWKVVSPVEPCQPNGNSSCEVLRL